MSSSEAFGSQRRLSEFVKPQQQLASFEVYHIRHRNVTYLTRITLEALVSRMSVQDYVRISAENTYASDSLYSAMEETLTNPDTSCPASPDVRWAIVLNYRNKTKDALGFGTLDNCVQVSSLSKPLATSSALLKFVQRMFPFMD
jgi:hypothetical protein